MGLVVDQPKQGNSNDGNTARKSLSEITFAEHTKSSDVTSYGNYQKIRQHPERINMRIQHKSRKFQTLQY